MSYRRIANLFIGMMLLTAVPLATAWGQDTAADTAGTEAATVAEAPAEPAPLTSEELATKVGEALATPKVMLDTFWVMITGMMVFFMNLGFACVESGFCRTKNCVNILSKNFVVFAVSTIGFWVVGWGLMFGDGTPLVGTQGLWFVSGADSSPLAGPEGYQGVYSALNWATVPLLAKFFFQLVFCGTAATIVSGAVAERIKYHSFILFSLIMAVCIYPVVGHWVWGGGFLMARGFADFAGSTQVHSIGGWAALTGAIILGPRLGKYGAGGKVNAIPGHNLTVATIGCFVLWFGWFGFNPGSTMGLNPVAIADIAVNTNAAAAAGTLSATILAWLLLGKPDLGMTLNGCLAGLVAITAPCAFVNMGESVLIGAVGGVLAVLGVLFFDRVKVDDPVGATSVHLVNGVFGTICVGLFADGEKIKSLTGNAATSAGLFHDGGTEQLIDQLIGVGATAGYVLVASTVAWLVLKFTVGLRVSPEEEFDGLDHGEHGNEAYHGFVLSAAREMRS